MIASVAAAIIVLIVLLLNGIPAYGQSSTARDARSAVVSETATLHLASRHGKQVFYERGPAQGSIPGTLAMQMTIAHYGHAGIVFTLSGKSGSLSGGGNASYYAAGATAYFTGAMSITKGTGSYSHATAVGSLKIQGTFQRTQFVVKVSVSGRISV